MLASLSAYQPRGQRAQLVFKSFPEYPVGQLMQAPFSPPGNWPSSAHETSCLMHSLADFAPVDNVVVPSSHFVQSASEVADGLLLLYVLNGHGVHVALLDPLLSMYIPLPHASGVVIPMRGHVLPRGQDRQASPSDVVPLTIPYLPSGHV